MSNIAVTIQIMIIILFKLLTRACVNVGGLYELERYCAS